MEATLSTAVLGAASIVCVAAVSAFPVATCVAFGIAVLALMGRV